MEKYVFGGPVPDVLFGVVLATVVGFLYYLSGYRGRFRDSLMPSFGSVRILPESVRRYRGSNDSYIFTVEADFTKLFGARNPHYHDLHRYAGAG